MQNLISRHSALLAAICVTIAVGTSPGAGFAQEAAQPSPVAPAAPETSEPEAKQPVIVQEDAPAPPAESQPIAQEPEPEPTPPPPTEVQSEPAPEASPPPVQTEAPADAPPASVQTEAPADAPPAPMQTEAPADTPRRPVTLTIATWGGAYAQSQNYAIFSPYEKTSGDQIEVARYDGSLDALEKQASTGSPGWDLVDVSSAVATRGCDGGLLEALDASDLTGAADIGADFIPGAVKPCAIGSVAWSAVMLYNKTKFTKRVPASVKDLFDLKAFPGKRALPKGPKYNLEIALMADGVEPSDVYPALSTPEGLVRALRKLDQIKSAIVWWSDATAPVSQIGKAEAVMGIGFNGRAFHEVMTSRQPVGVIWDGQIYDMDYWAIPKGAKHINAAKDFLRFALESERLAEQARYLPYGPVRLSALTQVGNHAEIGVDMRPHLPTSPENMKRALALDEGWWSANEATASAKFDAWLAGEPYDDAAVSPTATPR